MALEEWRHWMEGVSQPFLVLTDHKNLEYLKTAKRLNPRQATWALFFFYIISVHVCIQNRLQKYQEDALSHQHHDPETCKEPGSILSLQCFVNTITWEFAQQLEATLHYETPAGCPEGRKYVPPWLRQCLITWAMRTAHPGTLRTYELIKDK